MTSLSQTAPRFEAARNKLGFMARVRRKIRKARGQKVFALPRVQPQAEPPIFIIGVHRSGTTLLRLVLDSHSRIAVPRESVFLLPLSETWRDETALLGLSGLGFSNEHVTLKLRELADYFFNAYAASRNKPRWADKSPQYVNCLDFIEQLYGPQCKYVFIYRHGLDVACSIGTREVFKLAKPHQDACGDPFVGAARYWSVQCQKMLHFEQAHRERVFTVRYEEFVQTPEPIARQLFAFLGEAWEPQVLEFHTQRHDTGFLEDPIASMSKGFNPSLKNYEKLPRELVQGMKREAHDMLRQLGYEA